MHKFQIIKHARFGKLVMGLLVIVWFLAIGYRCFAAFAQEPELEFTLDANSAIVPLPNIYKPSIDLSGRGFYRDSLWPQTLASPEVLNAWGKDIGFSGIYRLQYNLWEIHQLARDRDLQRKLLSNYEEIIKKVSDAGGIIILDIFGTPAGLGQALSKASPPWDLAAFKELIKLHIRNLSCIKKYNIWYEVWSAPDIDDFFLGRKQDYFNLYRAVAESIKELEAEFKIHISLGAPSTSAWFQNLSPNTVLTPEHSLIYELIQFCYQRRLPLDFVSWHSFSSDPQAEKEETIYKKSSVELIRTWLTYFKFGRNTALIVDEWNFDRDANILPERQEKSYIAASYIPARLKNMRETGLDYQTYFSLEDFWDNREAVARNTGVFWFDPEASLYKGAAKSVYNVFRMLGRLGEGSFKFSPGPEDEFVGALATKTRDGISLLFFNYIDPEASLNFLSRNIARLGGAERKFLVELVKSAKLPKLMSGQADIFSLRTTNRLKGLLKKAKEIKGKANLFQENPRKARLNIKGLKGDYLYQRYTVDSSCPDNCQFAPAEEKEVKIGEIYQESFSLAPYSVNLVILKSKPKEAPKLEPDAQK